MVFGAARAEGIIYGLLQCPSFITAGTTGTHYETFRNVRDVTNPSMGLSAPLRKAGEI
jgi:hypothetical protein